MPELASSHFAVARMGFGRASEMMLSGRLVPGREAYERGLADFVTAPEDLMTKSFAIAEGMAANPDPMLRMTKELLTRNAYDMNHLDVQARETAFLRECWSTPEHKEAVAAFLEKRPARFR